MTRGVRKDQQCGAAVKPGEMFCTQCKKKKHKSGGSGLAAAGSVFGNISNIPNPFDSAEPQAQEQQGLDCLKHILADGTEVLKAKINGSNDFAILTQGADDVIVHGRLTADNKCEALSDAQKVILSGMGLTTFRDGALNKPVNAPGGPGIASAAAPAANGVQMPSILSQVTAPVIPLIPAVPPVTSKPGN
jgi:hypothetical protein